MMKISRKILTHKELEEYCFFISKDLKLIFATDYYVITNFDYSESIKNYIGCFLINNTGEVFIIKDFSNNEILLEKSAFDIELFKNLLIKEIKLPSYYWAEFTNSLIANYFIEGFVKDVEQSKSFKELFKKFNKKMYNDESITQQSAIYNLESIDYEYIKEDKEQEEKNTIKFKIAILSILFLLIGSLCYFEMYPVLFMIIVAISFVCINGKYQEIKYKKSKKWISKNIIKETFKNKDLLIINFEEEGYSPMEPLFLLEHNLEEYEEEIVLDFIYVEGDLFCLNENAELILTPNSFNEIKKKALLELKEAKKLKSKITESKTMEELIDSYKGV